ncbi:MAG: FMN-binding protein [bacterium]
MKKRILLSTTLVLSFILFVLYKHLPGSEGKIITVAPGDPGNVKNATSTSILNTKTETTSGLYKDGEFTGISADAYYGNIQVKISVAGGKITDVQFLDYPKNRGNSVRINSIAKPILAQEVIQAQSDKVDAVSGASATSQAFFKSISSAIAQAKK